MNIGKWYDCHLRITNEKVSALIYKVCKAAVNVIYPRVVKLEYGLDPTSDIIVSLTSFPGRIDTVWITIATILRQTKKPKAIILWLAEDQFPNKKDDLPDNLRNMEKYGLTIRFCDNLYPHKKYYYTMLENPDSRIVTVDDDVFYPEYLLEELAKTSAKYPECVCCTWAHRITLTDEGRLAPYDEWEKASKSCEEPSILLMPVGIGGVLYPPKALSEELFNKDFILENCLMTDDLWLKSMALMNNVSAVRINKLYRVTFFTLVSSQQWGLRNQNVDKKNNDVCLEKISARYDILKALKIE